MHCRNVHRYTMPCTCTNIMRCIIACASWNARHVKCIIMSTSCHMHHAHMHHYAPWHVHHDIRHHHVHCTNSYALHHSREHCIIPSMRCIINCTIASVLYIKGQNASCFTNHCTNYARILNLNEQECLDQNPVWYPSTWSRLHTQLPKRETIYIQQGPKVKMTQTLPTS